MFARLLKESFVRNPRRKLLTAAALVVGMAVTTATLTIALEVGDRLAREFRSLGANLLVTPESDTLPVEIGGMPVKGIAGPGPGAMLYASANGNFFQAVVVFHHGASWAGLSYDYQHAPCPASTPAGTSCVSKSAQSSITAHIESSARQVYALL